MAPNDGADEHIGRPSLYSETIAKKIIRAHATGLSKEDAARASGIAPSTLFEWQKRYPEFSEGLTRARDSLKAVLTKRVYAGTKDDPRLALEWLSRLWPDEFARTTRTTLQGDPEKPVDFKLRVGEEIAQVARNLAGMSPAELLELARAGGANLGEKKADPQ